MSGPSATTVLHGEGRLFIKLRFFWRTIGSSAGGVAHIPEGKNHFLLSFLQKSAHREDQYCHNKILRTVGEKSLAE